MAMLRYATSIESTITLMQEGICIIETDARLEIDYDPDEDGLVWEVTEFVFEKPEWDKSPGPKFTSVKPGHPLFAALIFCLDRPWIEMRIHEKELLA